jgi:acyl-coenzyme A synthetase/AMP-(fatty) acid ligase
MKHAVQHGPARDRQAPLRAQLMPQIDHLAVLDGLEDLDPVDRHRSALWTGHCKAQLAGFKVPRTVIFGDLPKTSTGKIQKFELRKLAAETAKPGA